MQLPWRRSRSVKTEGLEETEQDAPGPSIFSSRSPGLQAVLAAAPSRGTCRVLDLGPAIGDNVAHISSIAETIQIVDLFGVGNAGGEGDDAAVDTGLATLRSLQRTKRQSFHMVFTWDSFDYLPDAMATKVLNALSNLCRPGAVLHAIFHASETMPDLPTRYRIVCDDRLAHEPVTSNRRVAPNLPPARVERLLKGFHIEHSFVLRHGVREYVAVRTIE
jgi:hypothetical protein